MVDKKERDIFLGGPTAEVFFEQSNAWYKFVRNFMVSIVVLANSFYCVQTRRYKGLSKPMCLHPILEFGPRGVN